MSIELEFLQNKPYAMVLGATTYVLGLHPDSVKALVDKHTSDSPIAFVDASARLLHYIESVGITDKVAARVREITTSGRSMTQEAARSDAAGDGKKWDSGKLLWDLVPFKPVEEFVRVMTYGAEKYGPNNWQGVRPFRARYSAALMRHVVQYMKGEKIDPESGIHHLAHAICNCVFLMWGDDNLKEGE